MPSIGPMLYLSPRKSAVSGNPVAVPRVPTLDPAGERPLGCPAHGADCSHPHTGGRWSRAVSVLGLSLRPGNRHHDAVGVATQSRAGWTIAGVSASVVAVDRRPGRWSRGQGRRGSGFAGSARCSPSLSCGFLTAGSFPPLVAGGGWPVRGGWARCWSRCGPRPVGKPSGPGSPLLPLPRWWFDAVGSAASRRSQDRPQRNELWREGLHGRL